MGKAKIPKRLRQSISEQFQYRCAYCQTQQLISAIKMTIDHIIPESHLGKTEKGNLCLACWDCNLRKAAKFNAVDVTTGESVGLFHPQRQNWNAHFSWSDDSAYMVGETTVGKLTIETLHLNRSRLTTSRKIWVAAGWHPPK